MEIFCSKLQNWHGKRQNIYPVFGFDHTIDSDLVVEPKFNAEIPAGLFMSKASFFNI